MDFEWVLRGFCEELNPFLFEREREGYKRFVACTVPTMYLCKFHQNLFTGSEDKVQK